MLRLVRSPGSLVISAVFAVLLLTPAGLALAGRAGFDTPFIQDTEGRRPFVAPSVTSGALATGGWERDAEREVADGFPLRTSLVRANSYIKFRWLGDSASYLVIRGSDGWLFVGAEERDYLAGAPSDADLARVADIYASRARWCARHGMRYAFLLAPNKSTIYPQYLPAGITPVQPSGADRLLPMLKARGVRTIDVRADLIRASHAGDVYTRYDTHWNDAGAYPAYRATVAAFADAGVRDTIAPRSLRPRIDLTGADLLRLGALDGMVQDEWLHYDFPHRARNAPEPAYPNDPDLDTYLRYATVRDDATLPIAVVFGDSFIEQLRPFLAESFRRTVFLHHNAVSDNQFDTHALEAERPTVVIQELVERNLVKAATFKP